MGRRKVILLIAEPFPVHDGGDIARTVQYPNNYDFGLARKIVNRIIPLKNHAQIGREMKARSAA